MKALALALVIVALASCATITNGSAVPDTSDYTARSQADGSIELIVTGTTAQPTGNRKAQIEFGPILESAAEKECPSGYDLTKDAKPTVRAESGRLIATLRAVARCK